MGKKQKLAFIYCKFGILAYTMYTMYITIHIENLAY